MSTDQWDLFLLGAALAIVYTGFQMTQSKATGVALIAGGLCWFWWLFFPLLASKYQIPNESHFLWLFGGWAVALLACAIYGRLIYEPAIATTSLPLVSSTNQSGGITGNPNIVINPVPNAKPKISLAQQTELVFFSREGKQIRETYRVPNDVDRAPAKKWVKKVADYLEKNIGPITADRFLSNEGILSRYLLDTNVSRMNEKTYLHLSNRLLRLDEIMKKLED